MVNHTTAREESVQPHGIDVIAAGIALRMRAFEARGRKSAPRVKTTDLRKAYKQLGVSEEGLIDNYICVTHPDTLMPEVYSCKVLPFGACAAVSAFCRVSMAVWHLGCEFLWLHWSVYYDDFFSVTEPQSAAHCDLCIAGLFSLLGWDISKDKELPFSTLARVLGVNICIMSESLFRVENTPERREELAEQLTLSWPRAFTPAQGSAAVVRRTTLRAQVFPGHENHK